ncbi:hypothetical protein NMG29_00315 [Streptomyces cocklensis]|jgi:hypothetical protein|uniref:Uncharacterized protein n=1 Tax=Actinacidiphila cocklensis TaxID=887465 RepID=A0A9W4DXS6_9ACTN|nr:hypothetical protein [Actinacidiphila cocklensis]MDD1056693.1 hypothetical protein [Actinacidiphila cocklensis]CAG6397838.1 conserved hypothetical protein [Actinacidiphila cocklensis]
MTIGETDLVGLVTKIVSASPEDREYGANTCSDWSSLFDQDEADLLVRILALTAASEDQETIREIQLHALLRIDEHLLVRPELLAPLRRLFSAQLDEEQADYLTELGVRP